MEPISFELPIERAWGFFNNAHGQRLYGRHFPPYVLRPFPDAIFEAVGDRPCMNRSHVFDNHWRFDLLRPLYGGTADYVQEFYFLVTSLNMILDSFKVTYRLLVEASHFAKQMIPVIILLSIPALIYTTLITVLSMVLSLLGLVTRPLMTCLLNTNEPDLKIKYECDYSNMNYQGSDSFHLDVKYTFIKGDKPTQYSGTIKCYLPLNLPDGTQYASSKTALNVQCKNDSLVWDVRWDDHKRENDGTWTTCEKKATGQVSRESIEEILKWHMERRVYDLKNDEQKVSRRERAIRLFDKGGEKQVEYKNYIQASERAFWRP